MSDKSASEIMAEWRASLEPRYHPFAERIARSMQKADGVRRTTKWEDESAGNQWDYMQMAQAAIHEFLRDRAALVELVLENSDYSADPATVIRTIYAMRGARVSFVQTPNTDER